MPERAALKLVIVWEHDLRAAAKALKVFAEPGDISKEQAQAAIEACFAAIYSPELADDDSFAVTIMCCRQPKGKAK